MIIELEQNRIRQLRKNPNRSGHIAKEFARALTPELTTLSAKSLIYRLLTITGTITGGYLLISPEEILSAGNCRTGINVTRAPQGIEALLIGKDPRNGMEIVRLNYPSDRLKEGTPVDSTTGRYEIDVSISISTTPRRYSAPCGQAVNIPLVERATTPGAGAERPAPPGQIPSWASWLLGGLGGLIIGGAAGSAAGIRGRRNAEAQRDQALTDLAANEATTEAEVSTLQTELQDCQNTTTTQQARITQLETAMNAVGVPIPPP